MTFELLTALALFAFVTSATPGPNNAMLLVSGANFGMVRSVPHMLGVSAGFLALLLAVGFGLGGLFTAFPVLRGILQVVGAVYLLYLAWKIGSATGLSGLSETARPQAFWQAAAFQAVNPKAWAMALGAMTTYAPKSGYVGGVFVVAAVFAAINLPCIAGWTGFGVGLRRFLDRPRILRVFNVIMAALLVASLYPLVVEWLLWMR